MGLRINTAKLLNQLPQVAEAGMNAYSNEMDKRDEGFKTQYMQKANVYMYAPKDSPEYKEAAQWLAKATGKDESFFIDPDTPVEGDQTQPDLNKTSIDSYTKRINKLTAGTGDATDWRDYRRKIVSEGLSPYQKKIYEQQMDTDTALDEEKLKRKRQYTMQDDPTDKTFRDKVAAESLDRKRKEEDLKWEYDQKKLREEYRLKSELENAKNGGKGSPPDIKKVSDEINTVNEKTKNLDPESRKRQLQQWQKTFDAAYGAQGGSYTHIVEVPYRDKEDGQWKVTYELHPFTGAQPRPSYRRGTPEQWDNYLSEGDSDVEAEMGYLNQINPDLAAKVLDIAKKRKEGKQTVSDTPKKGTGSAYLSNPRGSVSSGNPLLDVNYPRFDNTVNGIKRFIGNRFKKKEDDTYAGINIPG